MRMTLRMIEHQLDEQFPPIDMESRMVGSAAKSGLMLGLLWAEAAGAEKEWTTEEVTARIMELEREATKAVVESRLELERRLRKAKGIST